MQGKQVHFHAKLNENNIYFPFNVGKQVHFHAKLNENNIYFPFNAGETGPLSCKVKWK